MTKAQHFLDKKQILTGLLITKNYKKVKIFLFNYSAWLHLTSNNNFPAFISIEQILDQPIFLNPHTRIDFKHPTQEYFKFTIIRDLCRLLQPGLTSCTMFHKNFTRFSYCQLYRIFKLIMDSIPNDKKHLLRTEISQKFVLKVFCYNNKVTWKVKDSQELSKRNFLHPSIKIVLNSTKSKQYLNRTNLSNSFHGQTSLRNTIFSVLISGVKLLLILLIGLKTALMDSYIFSILYKHIHFSLPLNPAIHSMGGQHTKYSMSQM